jgi:predicted transcriptional regulator
MQKKLPDTSHEAHESMTKQILSNHHLKIIDALKVLKVATAEEIANYLDWDDKNRSARRMSELERDQIIYKPGEKRKTKYGRNAYVYKLVNPPQVKSTPLVLFDYDDVTFLNYGKEIN